MAGLGRKVALGRGGSRRQGPVSLPSEYSSGPPEARAILELQRAAGNRAVTALVTGEADAAGDGPIVVQRLDWASMRRRVRNWRNRRTMNRTFSEKGIKRAKRKQVKASKKEWAHERKLIERDRRAGGRDLDLDGVSGHVPASAGTGGFSRTEELRDFLRERVGWFKGGGEAAHDDDVDDETDAGADHDEDEDHDDEGGEEEWAHGFGRYKGAGGITSF